jgi:hypothetical protein
MKLHNKYRTHTVTCGLYYKHMTIVNGNSSIISEQNFLLIDDTRGVIYDCGLFIIQATGGKNWWLIYFFC